MEEPFDIAEAGLFDHPVAAAQIPNDIYLC